MVSVDRITKSFGDVRAVAGISFDIQPGQVVGLLGPNGAGKTTTMRILMGYLYPDHGSITVNGISVLDSPLEAQKHMGYLPENNPLYGDMLVSELLMFSANLRGMNAHMRKSAFDFVVPAVGLEDVFNRIIGSLSKGYRQRVGMALALLHKPHVVIMDEPAEGLDPNQRTHMRKLLASLSGDRVIIVSTHVLEEARSLCDRLIMINRGKIVADGTVDTITRSMSGEYTVHAVVEGENVVDVLRTDPVLSRGNIQEAKQGRVEFRITVSDHSPVQPHMSMLMRKHGWTLWNLTEERQSLEDVFRQVTLSEDSSHE